MSLVATRAYDLIWRMDGVVYTERIATSAHPVEQLRRWLTEGLAFTVAGGKGYAYRREDVEWIQLVPVETVQ